MKVIFFFSFPKSYRQRTKKKSNSRQHSSKIARRPAKKEGVKETVKKRMRCRDSRPRGPGCRQKHRYLKHVRRQTSDRDTISGWKEGSTFLGGGFESSRVRFGACIGSPSFSSCGSGASTCRLFAHASSTLGGVFASERATLALARG